MECLSYALIILFILAIWHLVFESVIASTSRFHMRNELFVLRDKIRNIMIFESITSQDKKRLMYVHDGICLFIKRLNRLDFATLISIMIQFGQNKKLNDQAENRLKLINETQNEEVIKIFKKTNRIIRKAVIINNGGWLIYLVPIIIIVAAFSNFKKSIYKLVSMPCTEARKIIPEYV